MDHLKVIRNLVVILGDQLNHRSLALKNFDNRSDAIWMAEVPAESLHVPSHLARTTLFLSAMRHFCADQESLSRRVIYHSLKFQYPSLASALDETLKSHKIEKVLITKPGDIRVEQSLCHILEEHEQDYEILADNHFICDPDEHKSFAEQGSNQRMEFFYRKLRKTTGVLMEGGLPAGGKWNYDENNRGSFPKGGPSALPTPVFLKPDSITKTVMAEVKTHFPNNPGSLEKFNWPVNRKQARKALNDFIKNRLPLFGKYQDAMWTGESWLYHSRLSVCMNLKLLDPREVIRAAEQAYKDGSASLSSVEGFIRQILGWREFVRLIYHNRMPDYLNSNSLNAKEPLPCMIVSCA